MDDVLRVWSETGWWDGEDRREEQIRAFFVANDGRSVVGRISGHTESVVHRSLGSLRYDTTDLSLGAITATATSRVARRQGLASMLTARSVAHLSDEGVAVAYLGMFEQGFYDRLGFGTGPYENLVWVYPGALDVPVHYRAPERFDLDRDIEELHAAQVGRYLDHGGVVVGTEALTQSGVRIDSDVSVYGYRTDGAISHYLCVVTTEDNGPDRVVQWAYQSPRQCLELLRLIQEWGDQLDLVRFCEPVWLQAQDIMVDPGREHRRTTGGRFAVRIEADAWWQMRIVDLPACIRAMAATNNPMSIVAEIDDPISDHLLDSGYGGSWGGLTGRWRFEFGAHNSARRPTETEGDDAVDLHTSIAALSQWWLGARSATTLSAMDRFDADPYIIDRLDGLTAHLPTPQPGWDF
jgi:predicted acetyltransferase